MSSQFYIIMDNKQEETFFRHVCETFSMLVLPVRISSNSKINDNNCLLDEMKYFLVRRKDRNLFRYQQVEEENGEVVNVIVPFNKDMNNLAYLEYAREVSDNQIIGRIWLSNSKMSREINDDLKGAMKAIKKWADDNCASREKVDGIWIYQI